MKKLPTLFASLALLAVPSALAQNTKTPADFVNLFETLSGKQPGLRKAHANGTCATATFVPNSELSSKSASPLFAADSVEAVVRFSMGSGNPSADQRQPGARGMAVQFSLPGGATHTIAGNTTPVFAAKDPDTFFGLLENFLPDENGQVDMAKMGQYIAAHPSTHALAKWQQTTPAPYSYGTVGYFGIHTFYFVDSAGKQSKFRWHITPDAGETLLTPEQSKSLPSEFLAAHLQQQFNDKGVSFTLHATIGQTEDTDTDPSQAWPADREVVEMGSLTLTAIGGEACTPINFDPNRVAKGFATSDDPVLKMRSPAYAISFGKRLTGQ